MTILKNLTAIRKELPKNIEQIVIITDRSVKKYYASQVINELKKQKYKVLLLSFPAGEKSKNSRTKSQLEEKMLKNQCGKDTVIVALGGGVVGDMAGFIAATYMRGIAYIQVPTTLLAMVDSSIGGKTGINTPQGKNLIGAFWQPKAIVTDIDYLATLPKKHIVNGLIEAFKMFLTCDRQSLQYFQNNLTALVNGDRKKLAYIVDRSIKIKANIVKKDEKDNHIRMILNFGHTIGHALEKVCDYKILHGVAVGYGILIEAKISQLLGYLKPTKFLMIQSMLNDLGIKAKDLSKWNIKKIIIATQLDKKVKRNQVNYVLLKDLGNVYKLKNQYVHAVADNIIKKAFDEITRGNQ